MSLLELKNVSKIYGDLKALDNVSLHVDQGEWVAIMGPSGSGKSTMMNIIGCMDKPTSGEVLLDGVDISKESSKKLTDIRRDKIGLIFQQFQELMLFSHCVAAALTDPSPLHFAKTRREGGGGRGNGSSWRFDPCPPCFRHKALTAYQRFPT